MRNYIQKTSRALSELYWNIGTLWFGIGKIEEPLENMGIFICFMDICLEHNGVGFEKTLYSDADDKELVLNAKYRLSSQ